MKIGDDLEHFLLLSKLEVKTTKNNKEYVDLELRDESLLLPAKMWSGFENFVNEAGEGDIIKVRGKLEDFRGQPQIRVELIRKAKDEEGIDKGDFIPRSKRDLEEMITELNSTIDQIGNSYVKTLLKNIFKGATLDKFVSSPAGKSWHHSYIHGLLEHTLEIVKLCKLTTEFHPEINRDLLVAGALLHDLGKTEELSSSINFDYTDKGKLLGHIVIAAMFVEKEIDKIDGFPEELRHQIIHLILSHQGKLEFASPVEPKTVEAIILYHADELSAKSNAYKGAIAGEPESGSNWTRFLPLAGTSLYIPPKSEDENSGKETLFDL